MRRNKGLSRNQRRSAAEAQIRDDVFDRDRRCRLAGSSCGPCYGGLTAHHLWKEGQGGEWSLRGLLTLCALHNDLIECMPRADAEAWGVVVAWGMTYEQAWRRLVLAGIVDYWWDGVPADQPMPDHPDTPVRGQTP